MAERETLELIKDRLQYYNKSVSEGIRLITEKKQDRPAEYPHWYGVIRRKDPDEGWGEKNDLILSTARESGLRVSFMQIQGARLIFIYSTKTEIEKLISVLGEDEYEYGKPDDFFVMHFIEHDTGPWNIMKHAIKRNREKRMK